MNRIFIILIILVLFSNSLEFDNNLSTSSDYSLLLDKIRNDVINEALLNLPNRENTYLLKMCIEMSKTKEKYSLNDPESAYLVYKWIADNIKYNCLNPKLNESPSTVFKEGKSGSIGIAALFNNMCTFMKIESNTISGRTKMEFNNIEQPIDELENDWNYILIDDNYYLIDVPMGAGDCLDDDFSKDYSNFFFGTKPEIFIRWHFPEDSKWQLLPKTITAKEFTSMIYLDSNFYIFGFKDVEPDSFNITVKEDTKIILTFDELSNDFDIDYCLVKYENKDFNNLCSKNNLTISKGILEIQLDSIDKAYKFLGIRGRNTTYPPSHTELILLLRLDIPENGDIALSQYNSSQFLYTYKNNMNLFPKKAFLGKKKDDLKNRKTKDYSLFMNIS